MWLQVFCSVGCFLGRRKTAVTERGSERHQTELWAVQRLVFFFKKKVTFFDVRKPDKDAYMGTILTKL